MKKILYLSHVSWGWIKQRPQFIAEELSKTYEVDCYYTKSNRFSKANSDFKKNNLSVKGFRFWPFERITFIPLTWLDNINKMIFKLYHINYADYDIIWITEPRYYFLIKGKIEGKLLVYDCMDDMLEFPYMKRYPKLALYEAKEEKQLLLDADIVLCSAKALQDKLEKRYGVHRDMEIVNNAITDEITTYSEQGETLPQNSLVYIGTISEWFDFKSVISALNVHPELNVLLYGPIRMQNPPKHERLIFKGAVNHKEILGIMNSADGLMMPFVVNELIESVNPVKLYEYIYSGKPICASRYGETEKFGDYVTLYTSEKEFDEFVSKLLKGEFRVDQKRMREYALQNTWHYRAEQVGKVLERYR